MLNGLYYEQTNELWMYPPHLPTFANIFMCFYESKFLERFAIELKSIFYRRYMDDKFLFFRHRHYARIFLGWINTKHSNSFLDINILKTIKFETSVFRKNNFTELGDDYFSFCSFRCTYN